MNDNVVPFRPRSEPIPITNPPALSLRQQVLVLLQGSKVEGVTWQEVAALTGKQHGSVSAVLSTMHKADLIDRLRERRGGCKVYVLPEFTGDRDTEAPLHPSPPRYLLDQMAEILRRIPTNCKHQMWVDGCRSCDIQWALREYEKDR